MTSDDGDKPTNARPRVLMQPETHPYIARRKQSLGKSFGWRKMEVLFETCDLAWYLVALDRKAESYDLASAIANGIVFRGSYNVWTPASLAIALAARLARLAGDSETSKAFVARLVANPSYFFDDRSAFERAMARLAENLFDAKNEPSLKWACHKAARVLGPASYLQETAGHGFNYDAWVDVGSLARLIDEGLSHLRSKLGHGAKMTSTV